MCINIFYCPILFGHCSVPYVPLAMRKHLVQAVFSVYDLQCSMVTEIDDKTTGPSGLIALIFRSVMSFSYFGALTESPNFYRPDY